MLTAEGFAKIFCICVPCGPVRLTQFCLVHDPFLRMSRGTTVNFVGLQPLIDNSPVSYSDLDTNADT